MAPTSASATAVVAEGGITDLQQVLILIAAAVLILVVITIGALANHRRQRRLRAARDAHERELKTISLPVKGDAPTMAWAAPDGTVFLPGAGPPREAPVPAAASLVERSRFSTSTLGSTRKPAKLSLWSRRRPKTAPPTLRSSQDSRRSAKTRTLAKSRGTLASRPARAPTLRRPDPTPLQRPSLAPIVTLQQASSSGDGRSADVREVDLDELH